MAQGSDGAAGYSRLSRLGRGPHGPGGLVGNDLLLETHGPGLRMGIDPAEKTPLVAHQALPAYVRHPIYALSAIMMLAAAVALPSPLMLMAAAIHISLLYWESAREERHLLRTHGAEYQHYRTHVGRFIPVSSKPYKGKDEMRVPRDP